MVNLKLALPKFDRCIALNPANPSIVATGQAAGHDEKEGDICTCRRTDRQTDRQTDIQTGTQTDRQTKPAYMLVVQFSYIWAFLS